MINNQIGQKLVSFTGNGLGKVVEQAQKVVQSPQVQQGLSQLLQQIAQALSKLVP